MFLHQVIHLKLVHLTICYNAIKSEGDKNSHKLLSQGNNHRAEMGECCGAMACFWNSGLHGHLWRCLLKELAMRRLVGE